MELIFEVNFILIKALIELLQRKISLNNITMTSSRQRNLTYWYDLFGQCVLVIILISGKIF